MRGIRKLFVSGVKEKHREEQDTMFAAMLMNAPVPVMLAATQPALFNSGFVAGLLSYSRFSALC